MTKVGVPAFTCSNRFQMGRFGAGVETRRRFVEDQDRASRK